MDNLIYSTSDNTSRIAKFDNSLFDLKKMELRNNGVLVPLKPQPARLLKVLLLNAPQLVSRAELQEKIWDNGTTVEFDHGLNACMNQLRTALKNSSQKCGCIVTVPKRGYLFVADITWQETQKDNKAVLLVGPLITLLCLFALILLYLK